MFESFVFLDEVCNELSGGVRLLCENSLMSLRIITVSNALLVSSGIVIYVLMVVGLCSVC